MAEPDLDIGKIGPCLLHAEHHKLTLECWQELRRFLHSQGPECKDLSTYKQAVAKKMGKRK